MSTTKKAWNLCPIITAVGEELTGIWTNITLRDPDGSPTGTLGIATDVTERVKAERELQAKRKELDHLTRIATMGELAASLAHELNQPLTAISNNAAAGLQMLRQEPLDLTEFRELLEDVCSDGKRAGLVIHSLKDLSRKQVNGRDNVKLNHLVTNTLKLLFLECSQQLSLQRHRNFPHLIQKQCAMVREL